MTLESGDVVVVVGTLGIIIHFITFVGIFTRLENRLSTLEATLKLLTGDMKVTFNRRESDS